MTKQKKIDYINEINDKFVNASNHGNTGGNWWYPKPNTIAYNVKIHAWGDTASLREILTERQNDYYSDNSLSEYMQEELQMSANQMSDDIDQDHGVKSGYAGRSCGWLEVDYINNIELAENHENYDVDYYYNEAKELDELENKIHEEIKKRHAGYNKYVGTPEYYKDLADNLLDDEAIAEIYKSEIKERADKLK